ncbi:MAG: hypothetical protein JXL67_13370 [Calditrichaeota bacterium]|nr:hypothetical protein [Calditrichota bacterium]
MQRAKIDFRDDIVVIYDSKDFLDLVPNKWRDPSRFIPENYFVIFHITDSNHPLFQPNEMRYWFWEKQRMNEDILFYMDGELGITDVIMQNLVMHEFNKLIP